MKEIIPEKFKKHAVVGGIVTILTALAYYAELQIWKPQDQDPGVTLEDISKRLDGIEDQLEKFNEMHKE